MISNARSPPSGGKMALFVSSALHSATGIPPAVVLPPLLPLSEPQTSTLHSLSHDAEEVRNSLVRLTFSSYFNSVVVSSELRSAD